MTTTLTKSYQKISEISSSTYSKFRLYAKYDSQSSGSSVAVLQARMYCSGTYSSFDSGTLKFEVPSYNSSKKAWESKTKSVTLKDIYVNGDEEEVLSTWTVTVNHDASGNYKDKTISATLSSSYIQGGEASGTITIPVIAQASTIDNITNFSLEKEFSVPITKNNSSYTDTLEIKYGSTTIKKISNYTSNSIISLSVSELLLAYDALGSAMSGNFTLSLTTKNGSTTVGTVTKTVTGSTEGTIKIKANGAWKNAVPLIKVNEKWEKAIAFIKVNGVWKRGNP